MQNFSEIDQSTVELHVYIDLNI